MNKIKTSQLQIIKLNNKTYIPFQLHQLPKYYSKSLNQFNLKGYCYISLEDIQENSPSFNLKKFKETLVFHKTYSSKNHR
tara:strand:- start:488 stop:727 length:240 start_codon:yes stop_codon:yes gene_type:complete